MPLAERLLDELDRITDLRFGGSDFKEVDSLDLLTFDLQRNIVGYCTEPPRLSDFEF